MSDTVVVISKTWLGHVEPSDRAFGAAMLDKFLHTLESSPRKPTAICLYTEGVRLITHSSPVLFGLRALADAGVRILVCQSCLHQYGLADDVAVGTVSTMVDIAGAMMQADAVIPA